MKVFFKWMPNFKHHRVIVDRIFVGIIRPEYTSGWAFVRITNRNAVLTAARWENVHDAVGKKITALKVAERLKS